MLHLKILEELYINLHYASVHTLVHKDNKYLLFNIHGMNIKVMLNRNSSIRSSQFCYHLQGAEQEYKQNTTTAQIAWVKPRDIPVTLQRLYLL